MVGPRAEQAPPLGLGVQRELPAQPFDFLPNHPEGGIIIRRPYNNRYNDASGAREDHLPLEEVS